MDDWQPIETAPKTRWILTWRNETIDHCRWIPKDNAFGVPGEWIFPPEPDQSPSHWMPLPAPPADKPAASEKSE